MTAAGSSAFDALHHYADQAAYTLGLSAKTPGSDEQRQADGSSPDSGRSSPITGPGNHPDDPAHPTNQPFSEDTVAATKVEGQEQGEEPKKPTPRQSQGASQDETARKPGHVKAIETALGESGPVGTRQGATIDRELKEDGLSPEALKAKGKMSKKGTPAHEIIGKGAGLAEESIGGGGERGSSDDDDEDGDKEPKSKGERSAKSTLKKMLHVRDDIPDFKKGPVGASRPDEAQREKIKEIKRQNALEAKHHHFRFGMGSRKDSERGNRKSLDGAEREASPTLPKTKVTSPAGDELEAADGAHGHAAEAPQGDASPEPSPSSSRPSPRPLSALFSSGGNRSAGPSTPTASKTARTGLKSQKTADDTMWSENRASFRGALEDSRADGDAGTSEDAPYSPSQARLAKISKLMLGGGSEEGKKGTSKRPTSRGDGAEGDEEEAESPPGLSVAAQPTAPGKWAALRSKMNQGQLKRAKSTDGKPPGPNPPSVVTELQTGILPVLMLKMSLERDETKNRRIPVLLNHLRLRITDSVNPLHNTHAVFRIELEYGDGLIRWVCYRELRDFINLHAHYRAAALRGYIGRPVGASEGDVGLPSFPKTSLPYFNQLQRQSGSKGDAMRAEFSRRQRESLEDYLLELIKSTMFRPEANRLCKFFEMSALSLSLASRGGFQGKQGYLRIMSRSSRKDAQKGIFTPASWAKSYSPKWFIVRESYIVICEEPDTLQVYDVFFMDGEFTIERPKRLLKQGLAMAHDFGHSGWHSEGGDGTQEAKVDRTALLTEGQFRGHVSDPEDEDEDGTGKKKKSKRSKSKDDPNASASSHVFYIRNAERRLKLVAKNERQMEQFIASMEKVAARNIFAGSNRFGSFAPIRLNCSAQWLVDGRDYYWNVSKALLMAKDRIMIHDWWLSPELYLRRPGTPCYRLDNILKKKASEGVKIFVIVYNEVSNNFTPTDSNYTKQRLTQLHPNIYVQRSPSHLATGTFYWAHHEKLCVIDETIAFMGGLDLCFGRWDTSDHVLVEDALFEAQERPNGKPPATDPGFIGPTRDGKEEFFVWPGQDYANERVMEWHDLTKPSLDLFDRHRFPRQPWHDVGIQLIGQPARDLCRHFTQRWNYLLRIKNHSRRMPFLIPPPDFTPAELQKYQLTGTCEVQICRSAGPWSLGTPNTVEHSIQNAYLKAIQKSEHFVYIENQFFVTSTTLRGTEVTNQIGSALVDRIIRAHRQGTQWRAVILIPLLPGFPMPLHEPDASSVRLILELQYASISRGENSIFGRLRRAGVDPDDYISFFSLRAWAKLPGGELTTEQIYPHDKIMVVDDRLVIIGSANINERSQRGDRDSELAVVVRDTDLIPGKMGGEDFQVGRFAHSLRVRLMREHLGVDVDKMEAEENDLDLPEEQQPAKPSEMDEYDQWDPSNEQRKPQDPTSSRTEVHHGPTFAKSMADNVKLVATPVVKSVKNGLDERQNGHATREQSKDDRSGPPNPAESVGEEGIQQGEKEEESRIGNMIKGQSQIKGNVSTANEEVKPTPEEKAMVAIAAADEEGRGRMANGPILEHQRDASSGDALRSPRKANEEVKKVISARMSANPWAPPASVPSIDPHHFEDPLDETFYNDMWLAAAVHNTQIYRKVFKCVPDDTVSTWQEYMAFKAWSDRLAETGGTSGTVGGPSSNDKEAGQADGDGRAEDGTTMAGSTNEDKDDPAAAVVAQHRLAQEADAPKSSSGPGTAGTGARSGTAQHARGTSRSEGFTQKDLEQMETLLEQTTGTLVLHPTRFLAAESSSANLLFPMDLINPLPIYN